MQRKVRRLTVMGGVILAVVIGLAIPAIAATASWGPVSSTYNGIKRVTGSGTFFNSGATTVKSKMTITDNAPTDGNTVYGATTWYRWYNFSWVGYGISRTSEWSSGTNTQTLSANYSGQPTLAQGEFNACAQMGFPIPDSCSTSVFRTIDW